MIVSYSTMFHKNFGVEKKSFSFFISGLEKISSFVLYILLLYFLFFQSFLFTHNLSSDQGSISSTFYVQLLHAQIPKVQKDTNELTVFFTLLGSTSVKVSCKTLIKQTQGVVKTFYATLLSCILTFIIV